MPICCFFRLRFRHPYCPQKNVVFMLEVIWKQFFSSSCKNRHLHYFCTAWTVISFWLKQVFYHIRKILSKLFLNSWIGPLTYFSEQPVHIISLKRRFESCHFIKNAAKRPNICFSRIGFISPDFRRSIVRSTCLSEIQTVIICNFWNIHIAKFCWVISIQKYICRLEITVHDIQIMESF